MKKKQLIVSDRDLLTELTLSVAQPGWRIDMPRALKRSSEYESWPVVMSWTVYAASSSSALAEADLEPH